jgi:hypothetical protein
VEPDAFEALVTHSRLQGVLLKDIGSSDHAQHREMMTSLARIRTLRLLGCINCRLTTQDIEPLETTSLEVLALSVNGLESGSWSTFAQISTLRQLYLDSNQNVFDDDRESLRQFCRKSFLENLSLTFLFNGLKSEEANLLARLQELREVDLQNTPLDVESLARLAKLPELRQINLAGTGLSGKEILTATHDVDHELILLIDPQQEMECAGLETPVKFSFLRAPVSPSFLSSMKDLREACDW